MWFFNLPVDMTGASVVVWGSVGLIVWGEGVFGSGAVVLTGGLVVRGCGLAAVLVITIGAAAVVWTLGLGVVLGRGRIV